MGRNEAKGFIAQMIDPNPSADVQDHWTGHLVLSGAPYAGKSSLAVAIATEFAFELGICRYLSLVKLLQFGVTSTGPQPRRMLREYEEFDDGRVLWRWDQVDLLIVDDVEDVARIEHHERPTPEQAKEYNARIKQVLTQRLGPVLQHLAQIPRTIWVCNDPVNPLALKALLEETLGYRNVQSVNLVTSMADTHRDR
jgi:hypothetical protein